MTYVVKVTRPNGLLLWQAFAMDRAFIPTYAASRPPGYEYQIVGPYRETVYEDGRVIQETDWDDMAPLRTRRWVGKRPSRWVPFKEPGR